MKRLVFALLLAVTTIPALAQQLEITPVIAYRSGGTFEADAIDRTGDVEVDDSEAYGVFVNVPLTPWSQIEFMANFQNSNFKGNDDIFVPADDLGDVDIAYYHVGFVFQGADPRFQPYGVISMGATNISPDLEGLTSETKFSTSFGGGLKVFFGKHVGVRLEGRGYYTFLGSDDEDFDDCGCCCYYEYGNDLWQGEVSAGLIMRF